MIDLIYGAISFEILHIPRESERLQYSTKWQRRESPSRISRSSQNFAVFGGIRVLYRTINIALIFQEDRGKLRASPFDPFVV